jgi:hypothetical protein
MKYKYVGGTDYLEGLPACDLEDSALNEAEKKLLAVGVLRGMYVPVQRRPAKTQVEKEINDGENKVTVDPSHIK